VPPDAGGARPGAAAEVLELPPDEVLDLPEGAPPARPGPARRLPTIRPVPQRGRARWPWLLGGAAVVAILAVVAIVIALGGRNRAPTGDETAGTTPPEPDPKRESKGESKGEPQGGSQGEPKGEPKSGSKAGPDEGPKPKSKGEPKPKPGGQATAPLLSDVTILSAKVDPLLVKFSVALDVVRGTTPFEEKAGLWFCFGKPETIPSLRSSLEKSLKGDDNRFFLNMRGPGFVAAHCSGVKPDPDRPGAWAGTIDLGKADVQNDQIEIPSAFGSTFYKVTEVPISWVYYDGRKRLSNELKAVVDLKAGKVVKVVEEAKQTP
jgi:hypothetical protein